MARLIPRVDVNSIVNGGERIVATELVRQLPESCLAYHSYPWLHLTRSDYSRKQFLQPGETDFIVLHPDHGLLVLEVKGGTIEYDPANHLFFRVHDRGGREQIQNPFDQAARNLYAIRDMILGHDALHGEPAPLGRTQKQSTKISPGCLPRANSSRLPFGRVRSRRRK